MLLLPRFSLLLEIKKKVAKLALCQKLQAKLKPDNAFVPSAYYFFNVLR